ncbi:MAG: ATP-binding protein [Pseudomonadota bacterium]
MRVLRFTRTVSGQFVLILVAALVLANAVTFAVLSFERDRAVRASGRGAQIERFAAVAAALATLPHNAREGLTRAASSRGFRLSASELPLLDEHDGGRISNRMRGVLRAALIQEFADEPDVRVTVDFHRHGPQQVRRRPVDQIAVSVQLPDGDWLNLSARRPRRPGVPLGASLLAVLTSLIAVAGVGVWFIGRLTRPIRALADAADLAGRGDRSARVPETGPGEVRRAASAFNAMQDRVADFDRERARTIAAVGHDLRTPITGLRLRAEMVDDDVQREATIRTLGEMKVIADGLLAYGQSAGEAEAVEDVDLSVLLSGIVADEPSLSFSGPDGVMVRGRPVALARAIGNLAGNAVRYAGGGRVSLVNERDDVVVTVADDGPGIDPARLGEVFEPFVRLEESRSSETGGAGLGLSIARQLIRTHGGEIALTNRPEGGLDAVVRLPSRRGNRRVG